MCGLHSPRSKDAGPTARERCSRDFPRTEIRPLRAGNHGARNKHLGIQRRPRFDRYGDTPDSLIHELTTLKATAEARQSVCGADHKSAAALIRESRCIDEAVAKIRGFLDKGSHQGCIPLAKHQFTIQLVTEALREFPEARKAVIAAVERAEEERNLH